MDLTHLHDWEKLCTEWSIIKWFKNRRDLGRPFGEWKTDVDFAEELQVSMAILLAQEMVEIATLNPRIKDQMRVANISMIRNNEGVVYYRNGYFIHLINGNVLHAIWRSVGDAMKGEAAPSGGAFAELLEVVTSLKIDVLEITEATEGTLIMLRNKGITRFNDPGLKEETDDEFGTFYVSVQEMIEEASPVKKKPTINTMAIGTDGEMSTKCVLCGSATRTRCSQCHKTAYCCREHQLLDWPRHKGVCNRSVNAVITPTATVNAYPQPYIDLAKRQAYYEQILSSTKFSGVQSLETLYYKHMKEQMLRERIKYGAAQNPPIIVPDMSATDELCQIIDPGYCARAPTPSGGGGGGGSAAAGGAFGGGGGGFGGFNGFGGGSGSGSYSNAIRYDPNIHEPQYSRNPNVTKPYHRKDTVIDPDGSRTKTYHHPDGTTTTVRKPSNGSNERNTHSVTENQKGGRKSKRDYKENGKETKQSRIRAKKPDPEKRDAQKRKKAIQKEGNKKKRSQLKLEHSRKQLKKTKKNKPHHETKHKGKVASHERKQAIRLQKDSKKKSKLEIGHHKAQIKHHEEMKRLNPKNAKKHDKQIQKHEHGLLKSKEKRNRLKRKKAKAAGRTTDAAHFKAKEKHYGAEKVHKRAETLKKHKPQSKKLGKYKGLAKSRPRTKKPGKRTKPPKIPARPIKGHKSHRKVI